MGCTFSCLILSRRSAHVLHVGDSRIYRLAQDGGRSPDDRSCPGARRSRPCVCSARSASRNRSRSTIPSSRCADTTGFSSAATAFTASSAIRSCKRCWPSEARPRNPARRIVAGALEARAEDNTTALVLDVIDLPTAEQEDLAAAMANLPILALPEPGDVVDGFVLGKVISNGNYTRLFQATDGASGPPLALKFPHPRAAGETTFRLAFVREAWVAARVRSRWIGEIVEPPPGRQTRLYSVMPFYEGETLEQRIRRSPLSLREGVRIAATLARAVDALHRVGVIHRDIKPDNVILAPDGGLRLIDLGVARIPRLEEFPSTDIPGTASYMAPELFQRAIGRR